MPQSTEHGNAGFTIIEVLVALALVAVSVVAIQSVMATSEKGVRKLEQHVALEQMARSVMSANLPQRRELTEGQTSGEASDYRWSIDIRPLGGEWALPSDDTQTAWQPELVRIVVKSSTGATSDIRTIRLIPRTVAR